MFWKLSVSLHQHSNYTYVRPNRCHTFLCLPVRTCSSVKVAYLHSAFQPSPSELAYVSTFNDHVYTTYIHLKPNIVKFIKNSGLRDHCKYNYDVSASFSNKRTHNMTSAISMHLLRSFRLQPTRDIQPIRFGLTQGKIKKKDTVLQHQCPYDVFLGWEMTLRRYFFGQQTFVAHLQNNNS